MSDSTQDTLDTRFRAVTFVHIGPGMIQKMTREFDPFDHGLYIEVKGLVGCVNLDHADLRVTGGAPINRIETIDANVTAGEVSISAKTIKGNIEAQERVCPSNTTTEELKGHEEIDRGWFTHGDCDIFVNGMRIGPKQQLYFECTHTPGWDSDVEKDADPVGRIKICARGVRQVYVTHGNVKTSGPVNIVVTQCGNIAAGEVARARSANGTVTTVTSAHAKRVRKRSRRVERERRKCRAAAKKARTVDVDVAARRFLVAVARANAAL